MIRHYLKTVFRHLWKYKAQCIFSLLSLSIGFICFAFSFFWIQHERSFDTFHPKADRIYRVRIVDHISKNSELGFQPVTPFPLASYLMKTFPEIEAATSLKKIRSIVQTNEGAIKYFRHLQIDTSGLKMFDLDKQLSVFLTSVTEEDMEENRDVEIAMTSKALKEVITDMDYPNNSLTTLFTQELFVKQEIPGWEKNTELSFDMLSITTGNSYWNIRICQTYILVRRGTNMKALNEKLNSHEFKEMTFGPLMKVESLILTPIKEMHYKSPDYRSSMKYSHIRMIFLSSLLVMFCSLLNFLILIISRIKTQQRNFAIQKTNGASDVKISLQYFIEIAICIVIAFIFAFICILLLIPKFKELATLEMPDLSAFYTSVVVYAGLVLIGSIIIACIPILYYSKKTIRQKLGQSKPKQTYFFNHALIFIQLTISIGFIFCSACMLKQFTHLRQADIGFNRHNIGRIHSSGELSLINKIKQIPSIKEILPITDDFMPTMGSARSRLKSKDGKEELLEQIRVHPHFFSFMEIKLIEGEFLTEHSGMQDIVINKKAADLFGKDNYPDGVIGVIGNFYKSSPKEDVEPLIIRTSTQPRSFLFKYYDGKRKETEEAIKAILLERYPDNEVRFSYMDDEYNKYFKSETTLFYFILALCICCLFTSVFGIFSTVLFACRQRRKEIAIRKVNGALVSDILYLFIKEKLILLMIASLIAFPLGHKIMKPWIEQYTMQTDIDFWIYLSIFLFIGLIIITTVTLQVWKTANDNPSEVIKSE